MEVYTCEDETMEMICIRVTDNEFYSFSSNLPLLVDQNNVTQRSAF